MIINNVNVTHDAITFKNELRALLQDCSLEASNSKILTGFLDVKSPKFDISKAFEVIGLEPDQNVNKFKEIWTIDSFEHKTKSLKIVYDRLLLKWQILNEMWLSEFGYSPQGHILTREIIAECISASRILYDVSYRIFHIALAMHFLDRRLLKNTFKKKEATEYSIFFFNGKQDFYNKTSNLYHGFIDIDKKLNELLERMKNDFDSNRNNLSLQNQQYAVNSGRVRAITEGLIAQAAAGAHVETELHKQRKELMSYENQEFDDLLLKINKYL